LSLELQNLTISENTKASLSLAQNEEETENSNSNNSSNGINNSSSSSSNNSSSSSGKSKIEILTNTFKPKSKRMSVSGPMISSPFNFRKNTDSIHLPTFNASSSGTYPSTSNSFRNPSRRSTSLSPNSIRKSLQQEEPTVSAPFNLKYEWGLKVKTSDNKIT
jgi:hypothetical protein